MSTTTSRMPPPHAWRPGQSGNPAGRRPGSTNLKTREIADCAARAGRTPLEVMLENMRWFEQRAAAASETGDVDGEARHRAAAVAVAKDAAPYIHPRLSAIEHSPAQEVDPIAQMTDAERVVRIQSILSRARARADAQQAASAPGASSDINPVIVR